MGVTKFMVLDHHAQNVESPHEPHPFYIFSNYFIGSTIMVWKMAREDQMYGDICPSHLYVPIECCIINVT